MTGICSPSTVGPGSFDQPRIKSLFPRIPLIMSEIPSALQVLVYPLWMWASPSSQRTGQVRLAERSFCFDLFATKPLTEKANSGSFLWRNFQAGHSRGPAHAQDTLFHLGGTVLFTTPNQAMATPTGFEPVTSSVTG